MYMSDMQFNASESMVDELRRWHKERAVNIECLVIAHDNPLMIEKIVGVASESTAILRVPQSSWEVDEGLEELIHWAIKEAGITQFVLVGHSDAWLGETNPIAHRASPKASSYPQLLERARARQLQVIDDKARFTREYFFVRSLREMQAGLDSNTLTLMGLFYLSDSGTFLIVESAEGQMMPIKEDSLCR